MFLTTRGGVFIHPRLGPVCLCLALVGLILTRVFFICDKSPLCTTWDGAGRGLPVQLLLLLFLRGVGKGVVRIIRAEQGRVVN
jgi:hypothetical protein